MMRGLTNIWPNVNAKKERDKMEFVDIIARGYEWICPECNFHNANYEWISEVECVNCGKEFQTNPPEHCLGK